MEDFYSKLEAYKNNSGATWAGIGEVIGKKEAAMRIAFVRKSLNQFEIKALNKHFFHSVEPETENEQELSKFPVKDVSLYVVSRQDDFLKDPLFNEFVEKMALRKMLELMQRSK